MKSSLKTSLIGLGALIAVASAGVLYAQSHKPADNGMMQGAPSGMMMQGGSGDMMKMMSQMTQMMESCSKMMQNMPAQPRSKDGPTEQKE